LRARPRSGYKVFVIPHRIEVRTDAEGFPTVLVTCDLAPAQVGAGVHALRAARDVQFRNAEMSVDDVIAMRDMTALLDGLDHLTGAEGLAPMQLTVARVGMLRSALADFGESGPIVYELLDALDAIHAEAIQAAVSGGSPAAPR
jgi:hypothetical protein